MIKAGRKPSSDPVQEKLRQRKALWNKDVSTFINDLINFKKTMNGAPSKFFPEKSTIKEPIPADPATIIGVLAGDFQEIAQKGNAIISEQVNYAKSRRKSKPKAPVAPGTPTPAAPAPEAAPAPAAPDLSKQLAAWEQKYELVAQGSNPISRFFTRLLTPTIGVSEAARIRKYRMSLLDACVKSYKAMGKLQVEIVKSSKGSVNQSNKLLHDAWNDWMLVYRGFSTYKSNMPSQVPDSGGIIPESKEFAKEKEKEHKEIEAIEKGMKESPSPNAPAQGDYDYVPPEGEPLPSGGKPIDPVPIALQAFKDYKSILGQKALLSDDPSVFQAIDAAAETLIMNKGNVKASENFIEAWQALIAVVSAKLGGARGSLKDLVELARFKKQNLPKAPKNAPVPVPPPPPAKTAQLEVLAQAFLKKWLGKTWHQMSLFDKTSSYRLDIFKMAGEVRKDINLIMDSLEKEMNVDELTSLVNEVNKKMTSLRGLMRALHMSIPPEPKAKGKGMKERMSVLEGWM